MAYREWVFLEVPARNGLCLYLCKGEVMSIGEEDEEKLEIKDHKRFTRLKRCLKYLKGTA